MKEKILELIEHHKLAKIECQELLNDLYSIEESKISKEETDSLNDLKVKAVEESAWRGVFINQLKDIID